MTTDDRYWIKHIPTHQRARVHLANCPHCRDGQGQAGQLRDEDDPKTFWLGPYPTKQEAVLAMNQLSARDVGFCGHCEP
jgi:hypothetical protein